MDEYDACLAMDRDPEVIRFVGPPWTNDREHQAFLHQRIELSYPEGMGYRSIFPRDDPRNFLGWIMLCPTSVERGGVEIGWRLKRSAWGQGYATEAAVLDNVVADIHPDNVGSIRVAEMIGLLFAGMVDYGGEAARRYRMRREDFRNLAAK